MDNIWLKNIQKKLGFNVYISCKWMQGTCSPQLICKQGGQKPPAYVCHTQNIFVIKKKQQFLAYCIHTNLCASDLAQLKSISKLSVLKVALQELNQYSIQEQTHHLHSSRGPLTKSRVH